MLPRSAHDSKGQRKVKRAKSHFSARLWEWKPNTAPYGGAINSLRAYQVAALCTVFLHGRNTLTQSGVYTVTSVQRLP